MKRLLLVPMLFLLAVLGRPAIAADTVYYYYTNPLHSAVVVTNAVGTVVEGPTYYAPYGQVLNRSLRDGPGYTGTEEDPATSLDYMQQRYYDPQSGRFLSADPVLPTSNGGGFNRYWYANNNPYRYTDPFGMYECSGNKTQCATVATGLQDVSKAAANLKAGSSDQNRLNAVVKFFGKEGVDNGVTVRFGDANGADARTDTKGKDVTITLNLKQMHNVFSNRSDGSTERSETAGTLAHEGTHGIDGRLTGGNPRDSIAELSTELNAFDAQAAVAKGLGVNSAYGLWNTGWSSSEAGTKREQSVISNAVNATVCYWQNGGSGC